MQKKVLGDKVMLDITTKTNSPSIQREPAGIIRPPVFELLQKCPKPFVLNRAVRP